MKELSVSGTRLGLILEGVALREEVAFAGAPGFLSVRPCLWLRASRAWNAEVRRA